LKEIIEVYSSLALMGEELNLVKDTIIKIQNETIKEIKFGVSDKEKKDIMEEYYFDNCILIPGFINGHTHIGDSFAKELGFELSIDEVVQYPKGLKHYLLNTVEKDIIIEGVKNALLEMLYSGTTTYVDFRENGIEGINIIKSAENRLKKIDPNFLIQKIILGRPNKDLSELNEILNNCDGVGLSSTNLYSDDELIEIKTICNKLNKIISVHVSETKEEHFNAEKEFGSSDVYRAILLLEANPIVHSIHINKNDLNLIKVKKCNIIICPRANSYFSVGFPPIQEFLQNNILFGLGTDNTMANSLNLFREFEYVIKYMRSIFGPTIINPIEIIKMSTTYPAKIYNLTDRGWLGKNMRADFIVLDLNKPHLQPLNRIYETITLRTHPGDIKTMFVGGNKIEIPK